jgi:radical SAM-linked protein
MFKDMRVRFCKQESAIYFSHLDLNRVVMRALRRSGIPYWSKGGFSPHPYCVFAQPLSLGFESEGELFDFRLLENTEFDPQALMDAFPSSLKILEIYEPADALKEIAFAGYKVDLQTDHSAQEIQAAFETPLKILKKTKRSEKEVLLGDFIRSIHAAENEEGGITLWATLAAGNDGSLSPNYLEEGLNNAGISAKIKRVRRLAFYKADGSEIR